MEKINLKNNITPEKRLNKLYSSYRKLNSTYGIYINKAISERVAERKYAEFTMKPLVGLLKKFVEKYNLNPEEKNVRYATSFGSYKISGFTGPFLHIYDVVDDRVVSILAWNHGKIKEYYPKDEFEAANSKRRCLESIYHMRKLLGLSGSLLHEVFERDSIIGLIPPGRHDMIEKYDLGWNQLASQYGPIPIKGLNAVVQDQIAVYLQVPIAWIKKKRSEYREDGFDDIGDLGIVSLTTKEICDEVSGSYIDMWGGADLPLESGYIIHISGDEKLYFSNIAAAWMIDRVRNDPEYKSIRNKRFGV